VTFNDDELARVREIARVVIAEAKPDFVEHIATAVRIHAAECPVKAAVDDARSQAKGRKAVWALIIGGAGLAGSILGPFLKDAVAGIFK